MAEKVAAQAKLAGDQFSQSAVVIMHLEKTGQGDKELVFSMFQHISQNYFCC